MIEEHSGCDLARHLNEIHGEAQLKKSFVRQDVGRCCGGIPEVNESFAHEALSEYSRKNYEQTKETSHAGVETRRRSDKF